MAEGTGPHASPAFQLLIATSWLAPPVWAAHQEQAIRAALGAGPDWDEYLRLVDRHRTPALSRAALGRVPEAAPPEPLRRELERRGQEAVRQGLLHTRVLAQVLKALAGAGLPVMPLKGPLLSLQLYGDPTLRQARDLDLMLPQEALAQGQRILLEAGWSMSDPDFPLTPRQWQACRLHEHHVCLRHGRSGVQLELHWRNQDDAPGETLARWRRSLAATWQGLPHRAMEPLDQLLFLCCHGARHEWMRAKWLGDLARLRAQDQQDWPAALARARASGEAPALLQALALLEVLYGLARPALPGDPWRDQSRILTARPLKTLRDPREPGRRGAWTTLAARLGGVGYRRDLLPGQTWPERIGDLMYARVDYQTLRLPDRLFWAYGPLRPFLWAFRHLRTATQRTGPVGGRGNPG